MTGVHLTPAQARRLGISSSVADGRRTPGTGPPAAVPGTARTRKVAKGDGYWSQCKTCAAEFTTYAAEDRHVHDLHHARYEVLPCAT